MSGPLKGLKVIDLSQNSPGPMATMMLGDFGADVVHVVRPGFHSFGDTYGGDVSSDPYISLRFQAHDTVMRNKRSLALNLKSEQGKAIFLKLVADADILVEEMRPGKMAALGLGYEDLENVNPRLIYCSSSGYGQTGPMAAEPGHDLNYLAMTGILDMSRGPDGTPVNPQNTLADNGGGSMGAVAGILMALYARERTGKGQYIDAAATDGTIYIAADLFSTALGGHAPSRSWRGSFGGAFPHYRSYECKDGEWLAIGALERHFSDNLFAGLDRADLKPFLDNQSSWPRLTSELTALFKTKPRDEWIAQLQDYDTCVTPVLSLEEAANHPQNTARNMLVEDSNLRQVGISPKLSGTPGAIRSRPARPGEHSEQILLELGLSSDEIADLRSLGITQ